MPAPIKISRPVTRNRVTTAGWLWLLAAAIIWALSAYKGINLLTLLSYWMLLLWGLNALVAGRQLRHLHLRRWIEDPLFAGGACELKVEVENPHKGTHAGLRLEDRGDNHAFTWFISSLEVDDQVAFRETLLLRRRGWYAWKPLRVCSGYPFGLFKSSLRCESAQAFLVYPALGRLNRGRFRQFLAQVAPSMGDTNQRARFHRAAQNDFHGLRDYRAGDSPRWIHWRSSARRRSLMVREFEETPSDHLILVIEPWTAGAAADAEALETAVALAATICWEWCRQKGDRFVLAVAAPEAPIVLEGVTGREFARLALECLALLAGAETPDVDGTIERLADARLPAAPIVVLTTRPSDLATRLSRRLRRPVSSLNVAELPSYDFFERPDAGLIPKQMVGRESVPPGRTEP